jgi:DNA-binding response OmpR family regulator
MQARHRSAWRNLYMGAHIAVLSDSQKLRDVLQAALGEADYKVSSVCTSFYELTDLAGLKADLLILDWLLGQEDHGLQVLQTILLYKPLIELPTLVCAALTDAVREMETRLEAVHAELLYKPFTLAELVTTVHLMLENPPSLTYGDLVPNSHGAAHVSGNSNRWRGAGLRPGDMLRANGNERGGTRLPRLRRT